jgi:hypothetical protein
VNVIKQLMIYGKLEAGDLVNLLAKDDAICEYMSSLFAMDH